MKARIDPIAWIGLVIGVVALVLATLVVVRIAGGSTETASGSTGSQSAAALPSLVPTVEPRAGQTVTTTTIHRAESQPITPKPGQPLHLSMPAVGLDANVAAMTVAPGGSVDPPTPGSAYWLTGSSVAGPSSTGTTYIAGHTYRGAGRAVFNPFLDIPHSRYTVKRGDTITVGTSTGSYDYTVTDTELYLKTTVQQQTELWKNVPGRLVLVTCFQYNGGTSSQQNFVVYAQRDS